MPLSSSGPHPDPAAVLTKLAAIRWHFAESDPEARAEMEARISHAGKRHDLVTYSQLVEGLTFHLPTVNEGVRFQIDTSNWRDLDRAILGEFLGHISADTFRAAGFFATALVVTQEDRVPSEQFFKWMRSLGMIRHRGRDAEIEFWIGEVKKAHDWYSMHQPRA